MEVVPKIPHKQVRDVRRRIKLLVVNTGNDLGRGKEMDLSKYTHGFLQKRADCIGGSDDTMVIPVLGYVIVYLHDHMI